MGNGSAGVEISIGGRPVAFVTNTEQLSHITVDIFRVDKELQGLPQSQRWGGTYYIGSMEIDLGIQQQQPSNPWSALKIPQILVPFDTISIREWVMAILATPDCREFAKETLDALDKKRKGLGTLEEVAEAFFAQKGYLFSRLKPENSRGVGNPLGSLRKGDAKIFSSGSHERNFVEQLFKDVDTVIAELFHLAAKGQYYTDGELAKAVHNSKYASDANRVIGPQGQVLIAPTRNIFDDAYIKLPKVSKEDAYSNYFHAIQDKHCSTNPNRMAWFE
jgi:hypothetical protein